MEKSEKVENVFKNPTDEERKKIFTRLWIEIIKKTINAKN